MLPPLWSFRTKYFDKMLLGCILDPQKTCIGIYMEYIGPTFDIAVSNHNGTARSFDYFSHNFQLNLMVIDSL